MWHISTTDIPGIHSYARALYHYDRTAPWRGDADKITRPLGNRRARYMTFRKLADGSIAFRLYATDVVTWHPDNSVTINPYSTASTNAFATRLLPSGMWANFPCLVMRSPASDQLVYQIGAGTKLVEGERGWEIATPGTIIRWRDYRVDTGKAQRMLREVGYNAFVAWAKTRHALGVEDKDQEYLPYGMDVVRALENREMWPALARMGMTRFNSAPEFDWLRHKLYKFYDCLIVTERDYISVSEWKEVQRRQRKWRNV